MNDLSWQAVRQKVYERAHGCCEYCQTCEINTGQTMHVDHINPQGSDELDNLCLACWNCNTSKHKATTAIDPETQESAPLFDPRNQVWSEHFEWIDQAVRIRGLTSTGRATVERLKMNRVAIINGRARWVAGGFHPPELNTI